MRFVTWAGIGAVVSASATALAAPTLQFDVNAIGVQIKNAAGSDSAFGGLNHTGSINFFYAPGITQLQGIFVQAADFGPWADQFFSGSLSAFSGHIDLVNGVLTGGSVSLAINGGADSYNCTILPNVGSVKAYVGGGYTVQGLTFQGAFSDSVFGNVNVAPWFAANGGLLGRFIEFNFDPDANGGGFADMDLFVDAIPLPPAAWAGLATMAGLVAIRWTRRRGH